MAATIPPRRQRAGRIARRPEPARWCSNTTHQSNDAKAATSGATECWALENRGRFVPAAQGRARLFQVPALILPRVLAPFLPRCYHTDQYVNRDSNRDGSI